MRHLLIACLLLASSTPTFAERIKVVSFPGGSNLPVWVAQDQGYFTHEGLNVDLIPTAGSKAQMQELLAGGSQLVLTASDNVIAYGMATNDPGNPEYSALAIFMEIDPGFQNVVAAADIATFADLKGKIVAVDAPDTGYAFALFDILARHNLKRDIDYHLNAVGGGTHRWDALQAGTASAALLATPLELVAGAKGFHVLARMDQELGAYAGNVAVVRRDWSAAHRGVVEGFRRAMKSALAFMWDPDHHAVEERLLVAQMPDVTPDMAHQSVARMLDPSGGFSHTGKVDPAALQVVLHLRETYGPKQGDIGGIDRYILK